MDLGYWFGLEKGVCKDKNDKGLGEKNKRKKKI